MSIRVEIQSQHGSWFENAVMKLKIVKMESRKLLCLKSTLRWKTNLSHVSSTRIEKRTTTYQENSKARSFSTSTIEKSA